MKKVFVLLAIAIVGIGHSIQAQSLQQFHNAFINYAANSWANYQNQMIQNAWQVQQMQNRWSNEVNWDYVRNNASVNSNYNTTTSSYQQNYKTTATSGQKTKSHCTRCFGKGEYIQHEYVATFGLNGTSVYCNKCNKTWSHGTVHAHHTYNHCKGTGSSEY